LSGWDGENRRSGDNHGVQGRRDRIELPEHHVEDHLFISGVREAFRSMTRGFFNLVGAATLIALGIGAAQWFKLQ